MKKVATRCKTRTKAAIRLTDSCVTEENKKRQGCFLCRFLFYDMENFVYSRHNTVIEDFYWINRQQRQWKDNLDGAACRSCSANRRRDICRRKEDWQENKGGCFVFTRQS